METISRRIKQYWPYLRPPYLSCPTILHIPYFYQHFKVRLIYIVITYLKITIISKSCCGLLAGATKARISAHFALQGHLADVTAKESTQETAVAQSGLLLGLLLARTIGSDEGFTTTWGVFFLLLLLHQYSNYRLIRVLVFDTLNPQRCFLLTLMETSAPSPSAPSPSSSDSMEPTFYQNHLISERPFPRPQEVADRESIFRPLTLVLWGPSIGSLT